MDSRTSRLFETRDRIVRRVLRAFDAAASRVAGRPVSVRVEAPFEDLRRGRVRAIDGELTDVKVGELLVDHILIRVIDLHLTPGMPPRIWIPTTRIAATVTQRGVDRWLLHTGLPFRIRLTEDGLATSLSLDPFGIGEFETELAVSGSWLQLRPRRAGLLPFPEIARELFSGYLPLPKLPPGTRLDALQHDAGELTAHFELPGFDESLTAGLGERIRDKLFPREPDGPESDP